VLQGASSVWIGGLPAARKTDATACPGAINQIVTAEETVLIEGLEAARRGDRTDRGLLVHGCPTVLVGRPPYVDCLQTAALSCAAMVRSVAS